MVLGLIRRLGWLLGRPRMGEEAAQRTTIVLRIQYETSRQLPARHKSSIGLQTQFDRLPSLARCIRAS